MKKQLIVIVTAFVLLSVAVYAHGLDNKEVSSEKNKEFSIEDMNDMHKIMMESLEPELKQQRDNEHDGCISQFNKEEDNRNSIFGEMMNWGSMMS
jgi:hypothetical protein